jgi:heme/copper-type cytochrome/quinol oxidase subunit 2
MPTTARITASQRGDFTLACLTYCGYGHPYMELDGALVVR